MIQISTRRWLGIALVATLAFRFWLSAVLPLSGDEAYFVLWGRHPDLGFYDHPPMVGWLLALILRWSEAEWALRLPVTLLPPALALMLRAALRGWFGRDEDSANLAALCVLLVPLNFVNVLITTDTPLIFFSTASVLLFARAAQRGAAWVFLASGILLGLAFLSKYFAVLLGLGYFAWAVASPGAARRWSGPLLVFLGALPFALENLYWNYEACWCNLMFNAVNRQSDAAWSLVTPALYLLSLAYLAAPPLVWAWRQRAQLRESAALPAARALLLAWAVPFAVFALVSLRKEIGLHWMLSFMPALIASLALLPGRRPLASSARFFAWFVALHAAAIVVIANLPVQTWKFWTNKYPVIVAFVDVRGVLKEIEPYEKRYRLAASSYAAAASYEFYAGRRVILFGPGSSHARHDDILTDFRKLDGTDILVLRPSPPPHGEYRPYFRSMQVRTFTVRGVTFYAVLGQGFDYPAYRQGVLKFVRDHYYRRPGWLPPGRCYFCERYFGSGDCGWRN
ncbi:MAG TPA: glycosyltransferase family 39 protein [Burkholderiales bacterium]|nr:glycosyltransferase family 39 protein [Burkholderiales bacterium]